MTDPTEALARLLRCPTCHSGPTHLVRRDGKLVCSSCSTRYPIVRGRPVLLRPDNDVFAAHEYLQAPPTPEPQAGWEWKTLIPSPSVNLANRRVFRQLHELLEEQKHVKILVVGSGKQRSWLDRQLAPAGRAQIIHTDIDTGADVDVFCDAHQLPFDDGSFDAVVTTAVLEHVLYPEQVATEIRRVLKVGGALYSELPFMQQVHEGAYDFTRYTLSGHRRLFNGFDEIDSGMVAGPATALVWAIENFALAFARRSATRAATKALVRLTSGWIKYLDHGLVDRPEAMDGASCTFFFGRKIEGKIPDADIISRYSGAKHLSHT